MNDEAANEPASEEDSDDDEDEDEEEIEDLESRLQGVDLGSYRMWWGTLTCYDDKKRRKGWTFSSPE
jgi:hypothetical protein